MKLIAQIILSVVVILTMLGISAIILTRNPVSPIIRMN